MQTLRSDTRRRATFTTIGLVLTALVALPANGAIDPFNPRPVAPTINGASLQSIFQTNYQSWACQDCPNFQNWGLTNVQTQQSDHAMWVPEQGVSSTLVIELAGQAYNNRVGIFSGTGVGAGDTLNVLELFNGTSNARDRAVVTFTGNTVAVQRYNELLGAYIPAATQVFNSFLVGGMMGFYLSNTAAINNTTPGIAGRTSTGGSINLSDFYFTSDALNSTGTQALAYQNVGRSNQWAIAFEDLPFGSGDRDFDDFVFTVTGLQPTPEPHFLLSSATIILLLGGSVAWRRRQARG